MARRMDELQCPALKGANSFLEGAEVSHSSGLLNLIVDSHVDSGWPTLFETSAARTRAVHQHHALLRTFS